MLPVAEVGGLDAWEDGRAGVLVSREGGAVVGMRYWGRAAAGMGGRVAAAAGWGGYVVVVDMVAGGRVAREDRGLGALRVARLAARRDAGSGWWCGGRESRRR